MREYDFEKDGVTQGILATFTECKQMTKLKLNRWGSDGGGYGALEYGILMHKVFERAHKWQMANNFECPAEVTVAKWVKAVYEEERKKDERLSAKAEEAINFMEAQALATAFPYFRYWEKQGHKLRWTDAEGVFKIPYKVNDGEYKTFLRGRIDGVYKTGGDGIFLFDTKTKTQIQEEHYGEVLLRNFQINFYMLALRLMTGQHPGGFMYDVVRRPSLKLGANETLPEYINRVRAHIKQEGEEHYFKRYEVSIVRKDLDAFEKELQELLQEFAVWIHNGMPSRLFGMPCVSKYGLCEFVNMDINGSKAGYHKREVFYPELED